MYRIIYSPRAQNEVEEAIDWYEEQQDGLSKRFLSEVHKKIEAIQKQPDRYAIRFENFRVVNIDVFPYQIIYSLDGLEKRIIISVSSIPNATLLISTNNPFAFLLRFLFYQTRVANQTTGLVKDTRKFPPQK